MDKTKAARPVLSVPVSHSLTLQTQRPTPCRLDTSGAEAFHRIQADTGNGSEILKPSLDVLADYCGGEVLPQTDGDQRGEGLHSGGFNVDVTDKLVPDRGEEISSAMQIVIFRKRC